MTTSNHLVIPDKKYFTIGEISKLTGVKAHVLRYWEQVVPMLEPAKRSGRRYYQRQDLLIICEIDRLLNREGYTLAGALAQIKTQGLPDGVALPLKAGVRGKRPNVSLEKLETSLKGLLRKIQRHNTSAMSRWGALEA
jgi:DNA-binding transcriptional MerR regulator